MGAPKQKWTSEEESALKSGVIKHGVGKWRTILKDPEYNSILFLRSNVDLKDKWRNMSVTANGWGSREKGRMALRRSHHHHHHHNISQSDEDMMSDTSEEVESDDDDEIVDVKPLTAVSTGMLQIAAPPPPPPLPPPRQSLSRLETLIMEAITSLKEPSGSNKTSIAVYIEDQYNTPPNFKRILSAKVKGLASNGKLIKVNRKYRIAPSASSFSGVRRSSPAPAAVIAPPPPPPPPLSLPLPPSPVQAPAAAPVPTATVTATIRIEKEDMRNLMKSQIDAELAKMRSMSVQEAGAAAARAVAEAEAAMAEAEEAAREAEAAEADADAAQAFAEAAMTTLRSRYSNNLMVRG